MTMSSIGGNLLQNTSMLTVACDGAFEPSALSPPPSKVCGFSDRWRPIYAAQATAKRDGGGQPSRRKNRQSHQNDCARSSPEVALRLCFRQGVFTQPRPISDIGFAGCRLAKLVEPDIAQLDRGAKPSPPVTYKHTRKKC